jgi:hypothetical protein
MATRSVNEFLEHLQTLGQKPEDASDSELLGRFARLLFAESASFKAALRSS